jgi:uncharacterized protein YxjI
LQLLGNKRISQLMKYVMNQRWFSLGDDFAILDEKGVQAYHVDAESSSAGNRFLFRDRKHTELACVSQKSLADGPAYEIFHGDDLQAVVRKDSFPSQHCRFAIDILGPDDLHAEGNLIDHEYTFTREGKPVGRVSKSWFARTNSYGIDVNGNEDELLLLAGAMVIDLCCRGDTQPPPSPPNKSSVVSTSAGGRHLRPKCSYAGLAARRP